MRYQDNHTNNGHGRKQRLFKSWCCLKALWALTRQACLFKTSHGLSNLTRLHCVSATPSELFTISTISEQPLFAALSVSLLYSHVLYTWSGLHDFINIFLSIQRLCQSAFYFCTSLWNLLLYISSIKWCSC